MALIPVVYDQDIKKHTIAPEGFVFDMLSDDARNLLKLGPDGKFYIDANDILSEEGGNLLEVSDVDRRVYLDASKIAVDVTLSPLACNKIKRDANDRLYVLAEDLLSGRAGQLLTLDGCDLYLSIDPIRTAILNDLSEFISNNANNALVLGTDGKLYVPQVDPGALISTDEGNNITVGTDGKLYGTGGGGDGDVTGVAFQDDPTLIYTPDAAGTVVLPPYPELVAGRDVAIPATDTAPTVVDGMTVYQLTIPGPLDPPCVLEVFEQDGRLVEPDVVDNNLADTPHNSYTLTFARSLVPPDYIDADGDLIAGSYWLRLANGGVGSGGGGGDVASATINGGGVILPVNGNLPLTGIASKIKLGPTGNTYLVDDEGRITLPPYPTLAEGTVYSASVNSGAKTLPDVDGNVDLTGITTAIKVGAAGTALVPDVTGTVTLPDYATVDSANTISNKRQKLNITAIDGVVDATLLLTDANTYIIIIDGTYTANSVVNITIDSSALTYVDLRSRYYDTFELYFQGDNTPKNYPVLIRFANVNSLPAFSFYGGIGQNTPMREIGIRINRNKTETANTSWDFVGPVLKSKNAVYRDDTYTNLTTGKVLDIMVTDYALYRAKCFISAAEDSKYTKVSIEHRLAISREPWGGASMADDYYFIKFPLQLVAAGTSEKVWTPDVYTRNADGTESILFTTPDIPAGTTLTYELTCDNGTWSYTQI